MSLASAVEGGGRNNFLNFLHQYNLSSCLFVSLCVLPPDALRLPIFKTNRCKRPVFFGLSSHLSRLLKKTDIGNNAFHLGRVPVYSRSSLMLKFA